jgi:hypothetical protein
MSIRQYVGRHLFITGVLAISAVFASAGIALASSPLKGASYVGHYGKGSTQGISFKVSANGRQVIDLSVSTPFKCNGGCGGVESPSGGAARVSKNGTFKTTLKLTGPGSAKSIGSDTVTGTFLNHGKAKGTVTSHFNSGGAGETVSWTAAA